MNSPYELRLQLCDFNYFSLNLGIFEPNPVGSRPNNILL